MHTRWIAALAAVITSVGLSACGSSSAPATSVSGEPSLDMSVPLSVVACDLADTCTALGTTGFGSVPSAAAQSLGRSRVWGSLSLPQSASTLIDVAGCWRSGCLFGGSSSTGDTLWSSGPHGVVAVSPPRSGDQVVAISCWAPESCDVADVTSTGAIRVSPTSDGGAQWGTSVVGTDAGSMSVDALSCTSAVVCVLSASSTNGSQRSVLVYRSTPSAAASNDLVWSVPVIHASWRTLSDLSCQHRRCEALAVSAGARELVVSSNAGATWKVAAHQPSGVVVALSCVGTERCVAVGNGAHASVWVATDSSGRWTTRSVRYMPGPVLAVACGTTRCVAITATGDVSVTVG